MFCIYCRHSRTQVTNSRPHKRLPTIWRRRTCPQCRHVFTTTERPDLNNSFVSIDGVERPFNIGRLIISIAHSFQHDRIKGIAHASSLADTVMAHLAKYDAVDTEIIKRQTHEVLMRFDESAATAYGLQHKIKG